MCNAQLYAIDSENYNVSLFYYEIMGGCISEVGYL